MINIQLKAIILKVDNKNEMSLPLSVSLYLFSFTFNILFSIYSWINQLKQGYPIQIDSSAQHPSNEIINSAGHYCNCLLPVSWTYFWQFVGAASPGGCPSGS